MLLPTIVLGVVLIISGSITFLINEYVNANVPDPLDITKRIIELTAEVNWCGDNSACKNIPQQELNTISESQWQWQDANSAKEIWNLFSFILIILGLVLSIIPHAIELLPKLL
jgi:hypothetical protein